jgi:hypothetical protein
MPLRPPQRGTGGKTIKREKGGVDVTVGKKKKPIILSKDSTEKCSQ